MSEWKREKLSSLLKILSGGTPKTSTHEYWNGSIPWLSIADFNNGLRHVETAEKTISELGLNNSSTTLLKVGDIVISARGTVGVISQVLIPMAFNQSCYGLRANEKTINDFIYYSLKNLVKDIKQNVHGSVFDTITKDTFEILEINLPPLEEQKAIADVLSCLDDKIELNNKINKNLEEQAQALFKRWFVDFEFPNEDGNPYKSSGGEMIDSELGLIPKDWEVGVLSEVADIIMGQSPVGSSYNEDKVGTIFFQGRAEFGTRFPKVRLYTTQPTRMANINSTLLSVRAPVGDINVAQVNCCIGRGLASIKSNIQCDSFILYTMKNLHNELDKYNGEGTVFGSINKDALNGLKIVVAPNEIIMQFNKTANYLDELYRMLEQQNQKLAELRDYLLPKLMSGEIRVKL